MEEHVGAWLNAVLQAEPEWLRRWMDLSILHAILALLVIALAAWLAGRSLSFAPQGPLQAAGEWMYETLLGFTRSLIPHHPERYVPIIGGFFTYIFFLNVLGLIPGLMSPTSRLNTTLALAICSVGIAQVVGFRVHGVKYVRRFWVAGPGVPLLVVPFLSVLHLIEELVKPLSLALRLFGNISGDDMAVLQFALLASGLLGIYLDPAAAQAGLFAKIGGVFGLGLGVAMTAVMILFAMLVALIQAFVFSLLTGLYIEFAIEMD